MSRSLIVLTLKLVVTAAAIVFLFSTQKLQLDQLRVTSPGRYWIPVAALLVLLQMIVVQFRFWLLLRAAKIDVSIWYTLRIGAISWFLNASFLGGLGFLSGDALRVAYLIRESDKYSAIVGAALLDRIVGLIGLLTLASVSLLVGYRVGVHKGDLGIVPIAIYGFMTAAGAAAILLLALRRWGRIPQSMTALSKIDVAGPGIVGRTVQWGIGALSSVAIHRKGQKALIAAYATALVAHSLAVLSIFVLAHGIAIDVIPAFEQIVFAAPIAFLTTILPLPANGLGVGEIAFDTMLRLMQSPSGIALSGGAVLYLSYRILSTVTAMVGLPFFLTSKKLPKRAAEP